jgi:Family of unknown function (DUF5906)
MHGSDYQFHYSRYPKLKAYIDRIGAEPKNFKQFVVRGDTDADGYPSRPKARIAMAFRPTFSIKSTNAEYAPTEEELAAIEAELSSVAFPQSDGASPSQVDDLKRSGDVTGVLHPCYDQKREFVITCEERREDERTGKKYFVMWTLFLFPGGDRIWRQMMPDGDTLPFWKPYTSRKEQHLYTSNDRRDRFKPIKASVMIHEGPNKAAYIDRLLNDPERRRELERHPWAEELDAYEHWGIIGGANATDRCDFGEIRQANFEGDVVYVCDNDTAGKRAGRIFSQHYDASMEVVMFDKRFPVGFDLANPVPAGIDLRLSDLRRSATWATKIVGNKRGGNSIFGLTNGFADEWVHVDDPELYINVRRPWLTFTDRAFEHHVGLFAHDGARVSELIKHHGLHHAETINYVPGQKTGLHAVRQNKYYFNTHRSPLFLQFSSPLDVSLWEEFLTRLFPIEQERSVAARWFATTVVHPGSKISFGLLLISETQGVGKTTFADVLGEIVGEWNVQRPGESDITNNNFTAWREAELIIVEEIYAGRSTKAYNRLKEVITNKRVRVNKKHIAEYHIDNYARVIACSNSVRALKLDDEDRRWFVPRVTLEKQSPEYWSKLYHWLEREDGYHKVWYWARQYLKTNRPIPPETEAPSTETKRSVIHSQQSRGMELIAKVFSWIAEAYEAKGEVEVPDSWDEAKRVRQMAQDSVHFICFDVVGRSAIHQLIHHNRESSTLESTLTIRKVAKNIGFAIGREQVRRTTPWTESEFNGYVLSLSPVLAAEPLSELVRRQVPVINLAKLAGEIVPL